MPCIRALIKQVGRDFYLVAADERKDCNEVIEALERRNSRRKGREVLGEKKGVLLKSLSWPSLHYITKMLQH